MADLVTDLRTALKSLRGAKRLTAAAILILALGTGANVAVLAVAYGVLARPLPFADADRLVTIGKAYSGLTDAEIAEMTAWFEVHTIQRFGRYRQVEPTVVVEVAFDVIVRSTRHQSGFSLRFPRIARLRTDKSADEVDTIETVRALYEGLQQGAEQLVTAGARK